MGAKDQILRVRVDTTEKAELERRAAEAGLSVSAFVRSAVLADGAHPGSVSTAGTEARSDDRVADSTAATPPSADGEGDPASEPAPGRYLAHLIAADFDSDEAGCSPRRYFGRSAGRSLKVSRKSRS
jgi:Mobilization protein NikA